ncbi:uncharacterized protein LOC135495914 [Lineus longissimus]|uniref:uncharacterized protein LOC135495914 n=1 Tax=Lineus longissimus TaxID=88925 RepID=UPI002B4EB32D
MLHHVTSRPYTNTCAWEWPRPGEDHVHDSSAFRRTTGMRSFYVVHPDWVSEETNPPKPKGRTNLPWPWELPGARSLYELPDDVLRGRILTDMKKEDSHPRLRDDPHRQWKHDSPWYVNDPSKVPDSNVLEKRPFHLPHVWPENNQRRILQTELSQRPLEERLENGDLSKYLDRNELPRNYHQRTVAPNPTRDEASAFRLKHNNYMTYCDWRTDEK